MDGGIPIIFSRERNEQLADELAQLAGNINAATHRWLRLLAEFDNRGGWNDLATQSCAHWLNWKCGIDLGAAREKVRVAHALENLPKISAAMATGELSYSKVRALTRVATAATENCLLMVALHGTATHVEKLVRSYRRVLDAEELSREAQQQANRSVTYHWDEDGSLVLKARLPAEAGALVLKALDIAIEHIEPKYEDPITAWVNKQDTPSTGSGLKVSAETPTVKCKYAARADALSLMAESFLAHGSESMSGGDKHQIVVHVSAETLRSNDLERKSVHPEPVEGLLFHQCELEEGPAISSETACRLACDCSVVRITEDEDANPLDIGRKTRSIPPALRRALNSRDKGCRFPGCCNSKYTDGHHIQHWANGGETKLKNLVTLCRFHHHIVHEGGVKIQVLDDGAFRFLKANGESFECKTPRSFASDHSLGTSHESLPAAQWNGDRMDYHHAVFVLCHQERKSADVPVERF